MPLPRIRYDIGGYARAGLADARAAHGRYLRQAQLHGGSTTTPGFRVRGTSLAPAVWEDDPANSVVDSTLRSHDHDNLHVLGSATFPTGGTANPTLTIAAFSLRLAQRLKGVLVAGTNL